MDGFFFQWLAFVFIILTAVASPGPDFIVVVRNSVLHSQKAGIFTALGIALGNMFHVTYCIIGVAALIHSSELLFGIIKYAGVAYLVYIGIKCLMSKGYENTRIVPDGLSDSRETISAAKALRSGLYTNLLNPKCTMFYLALFTQLIEGTTLLQQLIYALTVAVICIAWFGLVSIVLNQQSLRRRFMSASKWIDRICGGLLIALGVKLALSKV